MPAHFGGDFDAPGCVCTVDVAKPGKAFPGLLGPDRVDNPNRRVPDDDIVLAIDNIDPPRDDRRGVANPDIDLTAGMPEQPLPSQPDADEPISFMDTIFLDAGNPTAGSSTLPEEDVGINDAQELVSRLPAGVQPCNWVENPQMLERIGRGDMSELMIAFLEEYHGDTNGVHDDWGYNLVGFHPLHTLVEALRKGNFPTWSPQVQSYEPAEQKLFLF